MKKEIKVGPIQRKSAESNVRFKMRKQAKAMKIGEFFQVTGVKKTDALNIRAALSYYSKQDNVKVTTSLHKDVLTIERIKK